MKKTIKSFLGFIGLISISTISIATVISCSSINLIWHSSNTNNKQHKITTSSQKNSLPFSNSSNKLQPFNNENYVISYNKLNQIIIKNNQTNQSFKNYNNALNKWNKIYNSIISNKKQCEEVINSSIKSTILNLFPNLNTLVFEIKNQITNNKITINELNNGMIPVKYLNNYYLNLFFAINNNQFYSLLPNFYYTYIPIFNKNSFNLTINLNFSIYLYNFSNNKKRIVYSSQFIWNLDNITYSTLLLNEILSRFSLNGVIKQSNTFAAIQFNCIHKLLFKQINTKHFPGINAFSWIVDKDKLNSAVIFNIIHNYTLSSIKNKTNLLENFDLSNWYQHKYLFYLPLQTSIVTYNNGYNFGSDIE